MPAGKTYVKIASQTLGSASASVTFSNLPQNYTDLVAVIDGTATTSFGQIQMRFNDDTGSNYSTTYLWGTGSAAVSDRDSNISTGGSNPGFIGTGRGTTTINVQNYSNQSTYKTAIARSSVTGNRVSATANLWRSTAAVNAIRFNILGGDTFASTTTFTIYGIECAKSPYAEGGDKVYSTGTHWVHEFYYSGQFVPRQNLTCDYLVIAGGGAGGFGGGGAGGFRTSTAVSFTSSANYTVTVGAGGSAGAEFGRGTNGNSSSISGTGITTVTSSAGGSGGGNEGAGSTGNNGGSGGGGGFSGSNINTEYAGGTGNSGSYSPSEGSGGGYGVYQGPRIAGGGGGGASAAGGDYAVRPASGSNVVSAGAGGAGTASSITGSSVTYAGGGGGASRGFAAASGGSGGGGNGQRVVNDGSTQATAGSAGSANTGGGGGGSYAIQGGYSGGSGIVIVRYAI